MPLSSKPVLVVDDDESIREFVSVALHEEGYTVLTATDGRAALAVVQDYSPGIILLDLWMPDIDGAGFLRDYRQFPPPRAPVVIFAASADLIADAVLADVDGYLPKPVELLDLLTVVARLTERR